MKKISLAYALKLKARLLKKVNEALIRFKATPNVYEHEEEKPEDKLQLLFAYQDIRNKYISLVGIIAKANAENNVPVIVNKLDGLKREYSMLDCLDVDNSALRSRNPTTGEIEVTPRSIQITRAIKDSMMADLNKEIDSLQDELDNINGSFMVEVDEKLLS